MDIIEKKFDVAIRIGHLKNSSLMAQKIATRREYICASPKYLEQHRLPLVPEDLSDHNCLSGGQGSWTFKKSGKTVSVPVKGNFKTNNPRVLLKAALDDLGIVRLPGSYVSTEIKEGNLISLLEKYSEGSKDIWVVTPTRNKLNTNVNVFVEELKKSLDRDYSGAQF
ncbi:substrate binding domain-containing protein [Bdellovibrio bacteriovorus]|uniref:substrate binding domain-containing protein n=1 Tax=Bdellovibrio bacteriovorus TaxID=959 RepID=UPI0021D3A4D0|nr:substrate binding domain-containing protein [Bdellovibrio bacteriovorus]UXR65964.1 substrate binding domain-containing protein [Bdellovibrio bacteriovorus]